MLLIIGKGLQSFCGKAASSPPLTRNKHFWQRQSFVPNLRQSWIFAKDFALPATPVLDAVAAEAQCGECAVDLKCLKERVSTIDLDQKSTTQDKY